MRKELLILSLSLMVVSCGKNTGNSSSVSPLPPEVLEPTQSIINNWTPTSGVVVIGKLNLSSLELNVIGSTQDVFNCDGAFGNNGLIGGVGRNEILITGTESEGTIQFGHTKYVGASDPECRNVSKEAYTYVITDNILELCMMNYPYCTTYEKTN